MLYLYLDESGDLGFDFFNKRPSRHFCVTVLVIHGIANRKKIASAIKKTVKRKLKRQKRQELKGSKDSFVVKRYFYQQVESVPFEIYALTLNKRRVYDNLIAKKDRVYNFIARLVIDQIPLHLATNRITLVIDRSKNKKEIREFNSYIERHLKGRVNPTIAIDIDHHYSHEDHPIQCADLFSWGIFRKYESDDLEWFNTFRSKIRYDDVYLK